MQFSCQNTIFMNHFLLLRRTKRFWKTNLKSVCRPLMQVLQYGTINSRLHIIFIEIYFCLQEPFCPPRPSLPVETVAKSEYGRDLNVLFSVSEREDYKVFSSNQFSPLRMPVTPTSSSSVLRAEECLPTGSWWRPPAQLSGAFSAWT